MHPTSQWPELPQSYISCLPIIYKKQCYEHKVVVRHVLSYTHDLCQVQPQKALYPWLQKVFSLCLTSASTCSLQRSSQWDNLEYLLVFEPGRLRKTTYSKTSSTLKTWTRLCDHCWRQVILPFTEYALHVLGDAFENNRCNGNIRAVFHASC